jgi:hypothetical protein
MQGFVVDCLIKILDEDVALASLEQERVALRPHDSTSLIFISQVVQFFECTLSW